MVAVLTWRHSFMSVCLCRLKAARETDKRIKVMNEVISGIRAIKMYAWEKAFKRMVDRIRRCSQ